MSAELIEKISKFHDIDEYRELNWEGTFQEYLEIVKQDPNVARTAYQRVYDMILS